MVVHEDVLEKIDSHKIELYSRELLGKGWPLGSRLLCLTVSLSLSHWYPGSDVVLDCIDS